MKLRIKFKKYGALRFIGHLDVMRFFQKAIRRAQIDVKYTAGFSPHQVMTFAAPLGVGLESNGEYMDIEVNSLKILSVAENSASAAPFEEDMSCPDIAKRLNEACVPGIEIVSVSILPEDAGNAMASVFAASYTVRFRQGREPVSDIAKALPLFLARPEILITKETKKGSRELNIRPGIYELTYEDGCFSMLLNASSAGNIKPAQVIGALLAQQGEELAENALLITRQEIYTNAETEEGKAPRPMPLGEVSMEEKTSAE